MKPVLEARNLTWNPRGRRVLGPLNLEVERGETLVLVGPNGAGKTTLLRMLAGVLTPDSGEVLLGGEPLHQHDRRHRAREVAYVPQVRPSRIPLTVEEVVLQGRFPHLQGLRRSPSEGDFQVVQEALHRAGIASLRERRVDRLSGGERQAVFIAAALAQEASILILDEPTTHLDPRHQADILEILRSFRDGKDGEGAPTVITASHDLGFASRLADRVCALREGSVMALGPSREILEPKTLEKLFDVAFVPPEGAEALVPRARL